MTSLAEIDVLESSTGFGLRDHAGEGGEASGGVAGGGRFDLDYVGALVGHEPCTEGAGDALREVDDSYAVKRQH